MRCFFVSDLHGNTDHYKKLFRTIETEKPDAVFFGGDLLPNFYTTDTADFVNGFLMPALSELKDTLANAYPRMIMIMGNDDPRAAEHYFFEMEKTGLIDYVNEKKIAIDDVNIYGYSFVPPTPFLLKDWEKYDISRYVPRDAVSPEEGIRTVDVAPNLVKYITIADDLKRLTEDESSFGKSIFLFHSPPYDTALDLMNGRDIDGKPELKHVGSIAIWKFIEKNQPLITMHGHIHESSELSGNWRDKIGETCCFTGAYAGAELALVRFDTDNPETATRGLI